MYLGILSVYRGSGFNVPRLKENSSIENTTQNSHFPALESSSASLYNPNRRAVPLDFCLVDLHGYPDFNKGVRRRSGKLLLYGTLSFGQETIERSGPEMVTAFRRRN